MHGIPAVLVIHSMWGYVILLRVCKNHIHTLRMEAEKFLKNWIQCRKGLLWLLYIILQPYTLPKRNCKGYIGLADIKACAVVSQGMPNINKTLHYPPAPDLAETKLQGKYWVGRHRGMCCNYTKMPNINKTYKYPQHLPSFIVFLIIHVRILFCLFYSSIQAASQSKKGLYFPNFGDISQPEDFIGTFRKT